MATVVKTVKAAVKTGIATVKEKLGWEARYKILLIGETGSGKTSFLNLICNYNLVQALGFHAGVEQFHAFNEIKFESDSSKMESKTSYSKLYKIEMGTWPVGVIDTPGFGDTRGMEEDKKHVARVIETLKEEQYINCVCLVINGRAARMSASIKYVLSEITAVLPKTVLDNIIVVFTNTTSPLHLTFDPTEFKTHFGCEINMIFCIENPYCLYEKAKERSLSADMIAKGLKDEFERTAGVLEKMFTEIKALKQVHTYDFIRLYEKKQEVERTVLVTLEAYNCQMQLENELAKIEESISAAQGSKTLHKNFENEIVRHVSEKTSRHNTICGAPGCYSNCHKSCNLDKSFDKEAFKSCWCIKNDNTCRVCGHSYRSHYHDEVLFEKKREKVINEETKRKFDEAKSAEERSKIEKKEIEEKKRKTKEEKQRLSEVLVAAIEEFQKLGISRSYLILLENQLYVIEQYLTADIGNKSYLEKTKTDLENKIKVVKDSIK